MSTLAIPRKVKKERISSLIIGREGINKRLAEKTGLTATEAGMLSTAFFKTVRDFLDDPEVNRFLIKGIGSLKFSEVVGVRTLDNLQKHIDKHKEELERDGISKGARKMSEIFLKTNQDTYNLIEAKLAYENPKYNFYARDLGNIKLAHVGFLERVEKIRRKFRAKDPDKRGEAVYGKEAWAEMKKLKE